MVLQTQPVHQVDGLNETLSRLFFLCFFFQLLVRDVLVATNSDVRSQTGTVSFSPGEEIVQLALTSIITPINNVSHLYVFSITYWQPGGISTVLEV